MSSHSSCTWPLCECCSIPKNSFTLLNTQFMCPPTKLLRTHCCNLFELANVLQFWDFRPTFVHIWKKGSVEQYSAAPYLATLMNCMVWLLYGLPMVHPNSTLVVTINGSGCAIEIIYLILFLAFSDPRKRSRVLFVALLGLVFVIILAVLILTLVHTYHRRSMIVGTVCILCNVMMYASPLSVMVSTT